MNIWIYKYDRALRSMSESIYDSVSDHCLNKQWTKLWIDKPKSSLRMYPEDQKGNMSHLWKTNSFVKSIATNFGPQLVMLLDTPKSVIWL